MWSIFFRLSVCAIENWNMRTVLPYKVQHVRCAYICSNVDYTVCVVAYRATFETKFTLHSVGYDTFGWNACAHFFSLILLLMCVGMFGAFYVVAFVTILFGECYVRRAASNVKFTTLIKHPALVMHTKCIGVSHFQCPPPTTTTANTKGRMDERQQSKTTNGIFHRKMEFRPDATEVRPNNIHVNCDAIKTVWIWAIHFKNGISLIKIYIYEWISLPLFHHLWTPNKKYLCEIIEHFNAIGISDTVNTDNNFLC